jgi:signal transduction histidine kinase
MDLNASQQILQLKRELHAVTEVAKTLTLPLELPELLDETMKRIVGVLPAAQMGSVMLWDQASGLFRLSAAFGVDADTLQQIGLRAGEAITGKVFDSGQICLLRDPAEVAAAMADLRPANLSVLARSTGREILPLCVVAAPVRVADQNYGVLLLESFEGTEFLSKGDLSFVQTIADLIALAIDRARLEAKADAVREARESERLRSELMATLSHELRMPLTTIKGYATALLLDNQDWGEEKTLSFLRLIDAECDTMQEMVKDILDSSIIDVNQLQLEPEPIRLPLIGMEAAAEVQRHTDIHRLVVEFPEDFPILVADPRWIKQVFRNILENAIKYSIDGGTVVVRGEFVRGEKKAGHVVVSVSDQGIGISPEDLIPLFEKFFRVKDATRFHISGTGLGLPIARAIVEAHGGRIWVESKLGQGTTVYFSLPIPKDVPHED